MFNLNKSSRVQNAAVAAAVIGAALILDLSFCQGAFAATEHHAHAEGPLPSFAEFLAEKKVYWINFLIYMGILSYVLKKTFVKAWANRRNAYQDAINSGQKLLEDSEKQLADARRLMATLPAELASLKDRMSKEVDFEASSIVHDASERAEKIKNQASQSAAAERRAAITQYQDRLVDLAMKRAIAKIPGLLSTEVDSRLKNKVVASVSGLLN